jgi:sirohydrochlorin cobaltochelatase
MKPGLLLFAHGSRNPAWADYFEKFSQKVAQCTPETPVTLCYLELCAPDFAAGVQALRAQACDTIRIVPVFLAPGKHTQEDLPALIAEAQRANPGVVFTHTPTLLESPPFMDALATAIAQDSA